MAATAPTTVPSARYAAFFERLSSSLLRENSDTDTRGGRAVQLQPEGHAQRDHDRPPNAQCEEPACQRQASGRHGWLWSKRCFLGHCMSHVAVRLASASATRRPHQAANNETLANCCKDADRLWSAASLWTGPIDSPGPVSSIRPTRTVPVSRGTQTRRSASSIQDLPIERKAGATKLNTPLGKIVGYPESLCSLSIERQMIPAGIPAGHLPVVFLVLTESASSLGEVGQLAEVCSLCFERLRHEPSPCLCFPLKTVA